MMGRTRPIGPYIREVQIFSRSAMGPDKFNPDLTDEGFAEIVQMLSPLAAKYNQHLFHVFPMDARTLNAPRFHYNFEEGEEGGRHQAKYKSQDIPPLAEAGQAQVVVCDTFKEQVIESKKDVFVLFYTIYDKRSLEAMAFWERMAAKRWPGVVFAMFDIKENDYPDEAL